MKKLTRLLLLSLFAFGALPLAQAGEVKNIRVEPTEDYVNIFWDALPADDMGDADGYAVQFSDRQSDVQINKYANLYLSRGETSVSLRRNSFENGVYYYLRVYSYEPDEENRNQLGNGSDLHKWRTDYWNKVESQNIAINDPVVTSNNSSSSSVDKDDLFDFGELRYIEFDTFVDFSWSKPVLMADSDFDGFLIRVSSKADLSDPLVEEALSQETFQARVKGLSPNTQYYAAVYFYDRVGGEYKTFGTNDIKSLKTLAAIPRDGSTRAARNIVKIEKKLHGRNIVVGNSTTTSSTTTTSSSSSTSSTSSTNTSTTTNTNVTINSNTADIRTRIAEIKRNISALERELRVLEAKVGESSSNTRTTSTRTSASTDTSGSVNMSRLKALLEARRNSR